MREIKLSQNKVALVDDEDFDRVDQFKWSAAKDGNTFYARRHVLKIGGKKQKQQSMHNFLVPAARIYDASAREKFGEFANPNFPK